MYVCISYLYGGCKGVEWQETWKKSIFSYSFKLFRSFDYQEACQKKQELAWIKILFLNQFYFEILKNKEFLGQNSEKTERLKDNG